MQRTLRSTLQLAAPGRRTLTTSVPFAREQTSAKELKTPLTSDNPGRTTDQHVTNSTDELDIHSEASGKGQRARESGDPGISSATSQRDPGGSNKKASEKTKAPGPVIGMQDERGGKGDTT